MLLFGINLKMGIFILSGDEFGVAVISETRTRTGPKHAVSPATCGRKGAAGWSASGQTFPAARAAPASPVGRPIPRARPLRPGGRCQSLWGALGTVGPALRGECTALRPPGERGARVLHTALKSREAKISSCWVAAQTPCPGLVGALRPRG